MADAVRILSIDGGGIRGIIPTMVLQAILGKTKAQDAFHIIAGTSTGGIIASALSKPNPLGIDQILSLYLDHGYEIFDKDFRESFSRRCRPKIPTRRPSKSAQSRAWRYVSFRSERHRVARAELCNKTSRAGREWRYNRSNVLSQLAGKGRSTDWQTC